MLVLGIDPGTATTGYGLVRFTESTLEVIEFGLIETDKRSAPQDRLASIYEEMVKLIKRVEPDIFAMESVFFATNAKTAIRVGQAQGVMLLSAASLQIPVVEYAPGMIKKRISGSGRADKKDIQKSVRKFLGSKVRSQAHKKTHFDNAADALAVALCHIFGANESFQKTLPTETRLAGST
jgi:crossover junction endodeoxyribonuclease RuvC